MNRPRLLFISLRFLFPLDEGGKIRTTGVLRAMQGGAFEIVLVSPAPEDGADHAAAVASVCDRFVPWASTRRERRMRRLLGLAGTLPATVASDWSAAGAAVIAQQIAAGIDLVVVDFPHAAVLLPQRMTVPTVIFTHNVETEIFERHAKVETGLRRLVWRREATKMNHYERDTLQACSTVVAVSDRDARSMRERFGLARVAVIDTGVDLDFYGFHRPPAQADTVVFSGAMDSRSNIDGIAFLMDEVWPIVAERRPDAKMLVVGRNPPAAMVAKAERRRLPWRFTGFVDDIRPHVLAGAVSVIPLRVGSGTRLKAFEAMALGRPVVSTTLGVEGLAVQPDTHFLAADSAEGFADAILRLLDDAALRTRLAGAARALLEKRFSWAAVGRQFETICQDTLKRTAGSARG